MKKVIYDGKDGKKHSAIIRDKDSDTVAISGQGIPCDPVDISQILEDAKALIHNDLVDEGISTWKDVQAAQTAITRIVNARVRNPIITKFKLGG